MAVLLLALALLAGSACSARQPPRIVGGEPTTVEEYPSIVQLEFLEAWTRTWSQGCGATIMNSMYVLTAGHCLYGDEQDAIYNRIRAGATYRNTGGVVVGIQASIVHPDLGQNPPSFDADIALLRLQSRLLFSSSIRPSPIVAHGFNAPDNLPVVYAGWGATSEGGPLSEVLRHVTVPTFNRETCNEIYVSNDFFNITQNMICTGYIGIGGKDACQGDSGGPLFYQNILIGVVSMGNGCARPDFPGVATAVASYTPWILENAV